MNYNYNNYKLTYIIADGAGEPIWFASGRWLLQQLADVDKARAILQGKRLNLFSHGSWKLTMRRNHGI